MWETAASPVDLLLGNQSYKWSLRRGESDSEKIFSYRGVDRVDSQNGGAEHPYNFGSIPKPFGTQIA